METATVYRKVPTNSLSSLDYQNTYLARQKEDISTA